MRHRALKHTLFAHFKTKQIFQESMVWHFYANDPNGNVVSSLYFVKNVLSSKLKTDFSVSYFDKTGVG